MLVKLHKWFGAYYLLYSSSFAIKYATSQHTGTNVMYMQNNIKAQNHYNHTTSSPSQTSLATVINCSTFLSL